MDAEQKPTPPLNSAKPGREKPEHLQALEFLSFVKSLPKRGTGRDWWAVPDISDDGLAFALGDGLAHEALTYMRTYERGAVLGGPLLLPCVLQSMVQHGRWGGAEGGFARTITRALIRGLA